MTSLDAPVLNIAHRALRQANLKRPAYRRFLDSANAMAHNKECIPLYDVPVAWLDACWLLALLVKANPPIENGAKPVRFKIVAEKVVENISLRRRTAAWRLINQIGDKNDNGNNRR